MASTAPIQSLGSDLLEIYKEESKTYLVTVYDKAKNLVDLTGATVRCTVRKNFSASVAIAKVSSTPSQITILSQVAPTLGQARIFFVPADTVALTAGSYIYDVWVVLAAGTQHVVVPPCPVDILNAVTDPP